jgi:hypothetical protein
MADKLDSYSETLEFLNKAFLENAGIVSTSSQWLYANVPQWRENKEALESLKQFKETNIIAATNMERFADTLLGSRGFSAVLTAAVNRAAKNIRHSRDIMLGLAAFCDTVIRIAEAGDLNLAVGISPPQLPQGTAPEISS